MMIASLVPHSDFRPVPRVEIRVDEFGTINGGTPETTGPVLSGGDTVASGPVVSGGSASMLTLDVPDGTTAVTVWRRDQDEPRKVQGVVARSFSGPFAVLDHAAPPQTIVSYDLEFLAGWQTIGRASLGETVLGWSASPEEVVLQNPLNPSLNAVVRNMVGSWPEVSRSTTGELVRLEGGALPLFVGSGPLSGVEALSIDFLAPDRATADRVWATLGTRQAPQIPIWLIRSPNPGLMPPVFYGRVERLNELDETVSEATITGASRFRAVLVETSQPTPSLLAPSVRYSDLAAVFGSYSAIAEELPRYSDWASAWQYGGAAG